jgi:hypothetical protein
MSLLAAGVLAPKDAAAQYSAYLEIDEGSVICRQGLLGDTSGPMLAYDAWLKDPRNVVVATDEKFTYSYRLDGQYSTEPQTSGTYTCFANFSVDGTTLFQQQQSRFINNCGDARGEIIKEYHDYNVNLTPACSDFASSGGSANFSWSELNGHFQDGNPHNPWGLVSVALTDGLEATRSSYNRGGIRLTSGYRCPHGNYSPTVGGAVNSIHMHGRAADMYSSDHPWTEAEFILLKAAANLWGPTESFDWDTYADHHYHAAW